MASKIAIFIGVFNATNQSKTFNTLLPAVSQALFWQLEMFN